jgi:dihydrofolate reductase
MRKVVSMLFISLDGVAESPDQWQFEFDADMGAALDSLIKQQDGILLGRVTYGEWTPYWPTATDEPFASFINQNPKYVVSTTLDTVDWGQWDNVSLLKGDLAAEINKLKNQPGKNIGVHGSPSLVRWLIQNDLLDELLLMIHPVIANRGKRLYREGDDQKRLKLVDSKATSSGCVIATYQPVKS